MLTPTQITALAAAIAADPSLSSLPLNTDTAIFIAQEFDKPAAPAFTVWRTDVGRDDVTVDGFDWTQVDNLTPGQARIWDLLFQTDSRRVNMAEAGKRAGISECWKGTAAKAAVATFVLGKSKRAANRGEALFASGTGSAASPGTMTHEGSLTYVDIVAARGG